MASASVSRFVHTETRSTNTIKKTVFLQEWWLIKAEKPVDGKILAVAGIHCRVKNQAMRQFSSAPILRAKDIFVLETTDGVCVMLEGVINQTRTLQNGFTAEVFEHFIFGFPPQWESFSKKCMIEEYSTNLFSRSPVSGKKVNGVQGSEDVPVENEHSSDSVETSTELPRNSDVEFEFQRNENKETFLRNTTSESIATGSSLVKEDDITASPREVMSIGVGARIIETIRKCKNKCIGGDNEDLSAQKNQEKDNPNKKSSNMKKDDLTAETTSITPKKSKKSAKKQSITEQASASKRSAKRVLNYYESPVAQEKAITRTKQGRRNLKENPDTEKTPSGSKLKAKKTISSGKKSSVSRKNTVEETPRQEKREVILSPESVSNKRSRSGRLLLPTLEFWRNQTVIYDAHRHITGIKQEAPSDQPFRGSKSRPKRKRA